MSKSAKCYPPRLAVWFLTRLLRYDLAEEVLGDLEEKFYSMAEKKSAFRARLNYWSQVFNYLRPFAIRKSKQSTNSNITVMFKHNMVLSYRSFLRYKSSFFINLFGLSTGLACTLLICLWVYDELKVDKFHTKSERLFQIMENTEMADGIITGEGTPDILPAELAKELPEVEYAIGVTPPEWFGNFTLAYEGAYLKAKGQFAGKDYFNVFSFKLLEGNPDQVLADKTSIVISEDLALRIFKTKDNVVGKTLESSLIGFTDPVTVTGVFEKTPANSTQQFDFVLSWALWDDLSKRTGRNVNWYNHGPETYVTLKEGTDAALFNDKIMDFIKARAEGSNVTLFAAPYADRYLYGSYTNGGQDGGRIDYVRMFSVIAAFILVIACINFMNLSTAKASRRLKEIGVKKALGAGRKTLIIQYLSESMLLTFLSLLVALLLVVVFLPQFNNITGKQLSIGFEPTILLTLVGISLITGLVSGSYPALYLSKFKPAFILKGGQVSASWGEVLVRRGLVVFQFALSVIFIVSVLVVYKQIDFIQSKNLGYSKDNVIHFEIEGKVAENREAFLGGLKSVPGVVNAAVMSNIVVGTNNTTSGLNWEGKNPDDNIRFELVMGGFDIIETLGIEVLEGRSFSPDFGAEESNVILNEAAIRVMGLENPIGKSIDMWGEKRQIVGVVKDFHFESLHEKVKPLLFRFETGRTLKIIAKIEAGKERETLEAMEKFYGEFNSGYSFDFAFMDQNYQAQYASEQRVGALSGYFAGFAILISCLGLFGLASFTAERRVKEIGIRKILGSTNWGIVYLLSSDFTKMVLAAILIALPVGYFLTKEWLQGFEYAISLEWWFFAGAGLTALFVAWLTVSLQTFKAASVNPAECLKHE